jgi:hypothetical protein
MSKLAVLFATALVALAAGASAFADTTFEARTFVTTPGALSDVGLDLVVSDPPPVAKIVIYVPQGYGLNTATPAGTTVGTIDVTVEAGGSTLTIPTGNIVADNPANYVSLPQAQACAPGAHAAVWVAQPANFRIPIYVDPTSGAEAALGAFKLQTCLPSPADPKSPAPGTRVTEAELDFTRTVLTNPSTPDFYLWRVLVTPYVAGTATPNAAGTYELRSGVFIPSTLTIKKKSYSKKTKRLVLTGKLTVLGKPVKGAPVNVFSIASNGNVKVVGRPKTNKAGAYSLKLKVTKTTVFSAIVFVGSNTCDASPPSVAPAGCVNESDSSIFANVLRVVPKK